MEEKHNTQPDEKDESREVDEWDEWDDDEEEGEPPVCFPFFANKDGSR